MRDTTAQKDGCGPILTATRTLISSVNIVSFQINVEERGTDFFAEPKSCGKPEQPPNSTMVAKNFNVGSSVDYDCNEGHLLVGPASRLCLATGFYNEFPPICKSTATVIVNMIITGNCF